MMVLISAHYACCILCYDFSLWYASSSVYDLMIKS